jgi:hypothetical protein
MKLRETPYAKELARATVAWKGGGGRLEALLNKERNQKEIRFSWWKDGRMAPRPLDLTEDELFSLMADAITKSVFTDGFVDRLRQLLNEQSE